MDTVVGVCDMTDPLFDHGKATWIREIAKRFGLIITGLDLKGVEINGLGV